jgi:hypothetical protein
MPKVALADTLDGWRSLLGGLDEEAMADLPEREELRRRLAAMIEATRTLVDEQRDLEGRRRAVTQQLRIMKKNGEDLAVKIRSAVRSHLGHRNEMLTRYGVRPTRRRRRTVPEEAGISIYARPDLLEMAGIQPGGRPGVSTSPSQVTDAGPAVQEPGGTSPDTSGTSQEDN